MSNSDDDSLSDIEQYYGFDFPAKKADNRQHRATWKKLIIYLGLFLALVSMGMTFMLKDNSLVPQPRQSLQNDKYDSASKSIN